MASLRPCELLEIASCASSGRARRFMIMRARFGIAVLAMGACGILDPDDQHPFEGTYDLTMSFTQSTHRGPCPFPQTGYCYTTDSVAFDRDAVFVVSNVRGGTFDALVSMQTYTYTDLDPLEGEPVIAPDNTFRVSRRMQGGPTLLLEGTLSEEGGLSGDVRLSNSIMGSSIGTFVGVRRP